MPVTIDQVRTALLAFEPNYPALAQQLGPEAMPHLAQLARDPDALLAAKAVYLAGLIRGPGSAEVVQQATTHPHVQVRVAAASASASLPPAEAAPALERLLADSDVGVRKTALRGIPANAGPALVSMVTRMSTADPEPALRTVSREALTRMRPR